MNAPCPLCQPSAEHVVARTRHLRVVRVNGPEADALPGFYRVIWAAHVAEWSDLNPAEQGLCMHAINIVERALRQHLQPHKINLATLGNVVPHLHWHVVARFVWDSHFPAPIWATAQRSAPTDKLAALQPALLACDAAIAHSITHGNAGASP